MHHDDCAFAGVAAVMAASGVARINVDPLLGFLWEASPVGIRALVLVGLGAEIPACCFDQVAGNWGHLLLKGLPPSVRRQMSAPAAFAASHASATLAATALSFLRRAGFMSAV